MPTSAPLVGPLGRLLALKRLPIVAALPTSELTLVAERTRERLFPKGSVLLREGEPVGFRLVDGFEAVRRITERTDAPVLIMTYWNPVVQYGVGRFADDLAAAGGAGLITPDLIPDEAADWIAASERTGLDRIADEQTLVDQFGGRKRRPVAQQHIEES